jgi:hypothetical protein
MKMRHTIMVLLASTAVAVGCGEDDEDTAAKAEPKAHTIDVAERRTQLEADPYDVRCADIRDERSTSNTRMVQNALAADVKVEGMNQLQVSQSVFYGLTEACKSKPGSFRPAKDAIAGVRSGKYRAEL